MKAYGYDLFTTFHLVPTTIEYEKLNFYLYFLYDRDLLFRMDGDTKDKLKVDALLMEYREIRQESRTYEVLMVICITLAILTFVAMFIAAISSHQLILLFISPLVSLFFVLVTMGILAYNTTLGLRASQIEDLLKDILGEPTIQFEATVGIFKTTYEDILTSQVGRYWMMISIFVILTGVAPIVVSLAYEYKEFVDSATNHRVLVWVVLGVDFAMTGITLLIGYSFFLRRGWEKLKLQL
jgi:hypothetical protein